MITRITLENYMSHATTVIEPARGLTVILGPNNCGKSAIASALQTVCGDHDGDFMLRHGQRSCQVSVETDEGHTIIWRRIKGKVSYVLDGVEIHRANRGNLPDDLHTLLRLPKVLHPNGEKEFDVHFAHQKSPIFLIDKESDTAAFFSTASDAEKLLEIQKLHKSKVTDARRQQAQMTGELTDLDAQLAALAPLDDLAPRLQAVEREQQELAQDNLETRALALLIEQMQRQREMVAMQQQALAAVAELAPPPALQDTQPLESLSENLRAAARRVQWFDRKSSALSPLAAPPELRDLSPLTHHLAQLDRAAGNVQAARSRQAALAELHEPPQLADPALLQEILARFSIALAAVTRHRQTLDEIDRQFKAVEADINHWLWANPNCPTCGAPTTREHLLLHSPSPGTPARAELSRDGEGRGEGSSHSARGAPHA
jgi:hypothetical protein